MDPSQRRDSREKRHRALAEPSRRRLLRVLEDADSALPVTRLSELLNLHPNTIRGHLDVLDDAGLVERQTEKRSKPGRPRALYTASAPTAASPDLEGYQFLSEVLASLVGSALDDPATAAEEVGRVWGRYLVDRPAPFSEPAPAHVVETIVNRLADFGFEPLTEPKGDGVTIRLYDCPFRDVARSRQDVVCSVHLGLIRGMAAEQGGGVAVEDLRPFVEPSLCLVNVRFTTGS
jgi:predicted ArsR family transcriptional regulator